MILPLVIAPDSRLKQKSLPVEKIDNSIKELAENMFDTMYENQGIGLAAVQVGVLKQVIVVDVEWTRKDARDAQMVLVNPVISEKSSNNTPLQEGCLSFPNETVEIDRPETITVNYLDLEGNKQTLSADGLLAKCIQHEIDHMNGISIDNYASFVKHKTMMNRLRKFKRVNK